MGSESNNHEASGFRLDSGGVVVAFYISSKRGSEYRAGYELMQLAYALGCRSLVTADLDENLEENELRKDFPELNVLIVESPVKKQQTLYRYSDFFAQSIWHRRAARRLLKEVSDSWPFVWVVNGAAPWLPLAPYLQVARKVIWGPVGCGAGTSRSTVKLPWFQSVREFLRDFVEQVSFWQLRRLVVGKANGKIFPIARSKVAQKELAQIFPDVSVEVIPEILTPVSATSIARNPVEAPTFLWIGQNSPRKNLPLAIQLFEQLASHFSLPVELKVIGVDPNDAPEVPEGLNVTFCGWLPSVDWKSYAGSSVLLLTSYREGLPSVVIEALSSGVFVVSADVGSVAALKPCSTLFVLPEEEYGEYSDSVIQDARAAIHSYLGSRTVSVEEISFVPKLKSLLTVGIQ